MRFTRLSAVAVILSLLLVPALARAGQSLDAGRRPSVTSSFTKSFDFPPDLVVVAPDQTCTAIDMDQLRHWATILGGRYMGEDTAEAFGERNAVPGELLARLRPQKVTSAKDLAD